MKSNRMVVNNNKIKVPIAKMPNKRRRVYKLESENSSSEFEEEMHDDANFTDDSSQKSKYKPEASVVQTGGLEPRRRGRGPSKRPCLNRNALMARENRQRKKEYLQKVENKLAFYQEENKNLMSTIQKQEVDIKKLNREVAYLRSILNNNSRITTLLKLINDGLVRLENDKRREKPNGLNHSVPSLMGIENSDTRQRYLALNTSKEQLAKNLKSSVRNSSEVKNKETVSDQNMITKTDNFSSTGNDHTYTSAKDYSFADMDLGFSENKGIDSMIADDSSRLMDQTAMNSFMENTDKKYDYLMPITPGSTSNLEEDKGMGVMGLDLNQLPSFGVNIFEDIPDCDGIPTTFDTLQDTPNAFLGDELFQNFDNTGVCLHVNSDKVSLEFCPACHTHSKNEEID